MSSLNCELNDDSKLNELLNSVSILVTPCGLEKCSSVEEGLKCSLDQIKNYNFEDGMDSDSIGWKFVVTALDVLKQIAEILKSKPEEMFSIHQQKMVKSCLEKVICLELLPNLLPGVGLGLSAHTSHDQLIPQHKYEPIEKYEHIVYIIDILLDLNEIAQFHDLLVPNFLGDILATLCQLVLAPYSKPEGDDFDKTIATNCVRFTLLLHKLASKTYQPMIIKEFMIIQGNKKSPKWLKRGVTKLLNQRLVQPGGVLATVRAITDASNTSAPMHSLHIKTVAILITTPHCNHLSATDFYKLVCPQIVEMLDSKDVDLIRIAVECCISIVPDAFQKFILSPSTKPLRTPSTESELTACIHRLHKFFAIPASDLWCLSVDLLLPYVNFIFRIYCKIYESASHVRVFVEDLVWCVLSKNSEEKLNNIFNSLIFNITCPQIQEFPTDIEFEFGDEGGLISVHQSCDHSLEEYGDALMVLLDRRDDKGDVGNYLFILLLKLSTVAEEKDTIDKIEKYLITVKLLAVLSENSKVQQAIAKNPKHIVSFVKSFIELKLNSCDDEVEIICLALMVLTVVLNDALRSQQPDWSQYKDLVAPLSAVREKTKNTELRALAEEAKCIIVTHGPACKDSVTENKKQENKYEETDMSCEEALTDACDPLLPVRGHAMMKLAKLIRAGDQQTIAKKETILCIFQENLKHEDSFLYLTAIEGLATLATEFPDSVMMALIDEYSRTDRSQPDIRLKVGEALVRVVRSLGELVPTYKTELLNAFLAGTRDEDALVRASSLANLGDMCCLLGYRLGSIASEILHCIRCIVQTDKAVEPRRAAVMVVTTLLKGLEKDALFVLQDILKELYSTLKLIYNTDKDDVTRLHAQLALEELDILTRAFLFPKQHLSRKIYVSMHHLE